MRVIRFMSQSEADTFAVGFSLRNENNHRQRGNDTDSVGFCFAIAEDPDDVESIYQAARRLSGIVNMQVCLMGTLKPNRKHFKKSYGAYADHDLNRRIKIEELCTTQYSQTDFVEWSMWLPNMEASPIVWSGSWRQPVYVEAA